MQRTIRVVVMLLLMAPGLALAQGGGSDHWRLHPKSTGPERGSMREIHGMMSQMGGMMAHMVDMIQGGTMTPEQTKQLGDMMGHMADMMRKLPDMKTADVPQQITPMMERMTAMQKQMMDMMAAPRPVPPAASQQEKK